MGLLEDIGNTLGNAVGALSNFMGDAFEKMFAVIVNSILGSANDILGLTKSPSSIFHYSTAADGLQVREFLADKQQWSFAMSREDMKTDFGEVAFPELLEAIDILHRTGKEDIDLKASVSCICGIIPFGVLDGIDRVFDDMDLTYGTKMFLMAKKQMEQQTRFWIPYQRYLNSKNPNTIPGPGDIVRFALREVYDELRRGELLTEPPGQGYYDQMLENGFNKYNSNSFWASHWVLPSVGQLDEMIHRTTLDPTSASGAALSTPYGGSYYRVIDDETWDRFVKYNDFDPVVRPWLKRISYKPYTRVDVRRMYDVGVLDDNEIYRTYLDLGYDEEHAENMTVWTKVYVKVGELRARYSKGWITAEELEQAFVDEGLSPAKAKTYTEKLVKAEAEEAAGKERDLTKSDITRSVAKGLISQDDAVERLTELGYDEDEAVFIIQNVVAEAVAEEIAVDRDISKTEIIEGVKLGVLPRNEAIPMLEKLGYSTDEANYILDLRVLPVHIDRIVKERDLTKAELVKGVKKGIITDAQAVTMLEDMGYDNAEAWFIIDINVEALAGSPEAWSDFQRIVNRDRKARGQVVKDIPSEIPSLETKIKEYAAKLTAAEAEKKPRQELEAIKASLNPLKRQHNEAVRRYRG